MIVIEELEVAAEKLKVYDVDQAAWEQEPNGFKANVTHALCHLAKDITGKNFEDCETIQSAIAPDSLQYALRFARWTGQTSRVVLPTRDQVNIVNLLARNNGFGAMPLPQVAFVEAAATIARNLHDQDHATTKTEADYDILHSARRAGRLLVYGACLQADEHGFDLPEAFDERLTNLRTRFGISEPAALTE